MTKKIVSILLAFFITVVLVAVLFSHINLNDILTVLTGIDPLSFAIGFILYTFSYVFRSLRFYFLFKKEIGFRDLFDIVCIHNMANNILPARTGELSYVYLLKKLHHKNVGEGVVSLTIARVLDLIAVSLFFLASAYQIRDMSPEIIEVIFVICLFMLALISFLLLIIFFGTTFSSVLHKIFSALDLHDNKLSAFLLSKISNLMESFDDLRKIKKDALMKVFFSSLGIWMSMYFFNCFIVNAMDVRMSFFLVVFATSFAIFTTILPIQGIGGFGTLEGGWVIGFVAVGLTKEIAITTGFTYHIILWMYFLLLGSLGLLSVKLKY